MCTHECLHIVIGLLITPSCCRFGQYVAWISGNQTIPYPVGDVTYDEFTQYAARFYNDSSIAPKAQEIFKNHITTVQNRVNTVNGKTYKEDPVIMCMFTTTKNDVPLCLMLYVYSMAVSQ